LTQRNYIPALVITQSQDDADTLNRALRSAGHAVRPVWVSRFDALEKELGKQEPDLIISYTKGAGAGLSRVVQLRDKHAPLSPVIAISEDASEESVAKAIHNGARDMVSLDQTERLIAIITRELEVLKLARSLREAQEALKEYEKRFESMMAESADALAYIQEGIHVNANPAYLELFGYQSGDELEGMPVMDLFAGKSQKKLKSIMRDLLKGKSMDGPLQLTGQRTDGSTFEVTTELRALEMGGEPALELLIRSEGGGSSEDLERQLADLEKRDQLTGLFNRSYFGQVLPQSFAARNQTRSCNALVAIVPDRIVALKEKLGTVAFDAVLKGLADLLQNQSTEDDICCRFDDTVLMALVQRGKLGEVEKWAEKLRKTVAGHVFEADGQSTAMTCSFGIADMNETQNRADDLLKQVEHAIGQAAAAGGNCIVRYEPPEVDEEGRLSDHAWAKRLKAGLEKNLFQLVYQPVADLQGGEGEVYDILVQLRDVDGEEFAAAEFIPAAERSKMMPQIDRWVFENTLKVLKDRTAKGQKPIYFVRVSEQSLGDPEMLKWFLDQLKKGGVPGEHVVFEVSETTVDKRLKESKAFSDFARKQGCGFAIEHFGIGLNSMQTLEHLDMDYLKIDGSFMEDIESDEGKREQVQEFVDKASSRNIKTVAERVEEATTMAVLFQIGVTFIQGNYVQEPELVIAEGE
jgi:diguanylate cyclase (GGDEF)-like protein/PAS domain S-box-containing protein